MNRHPDEERIEQDEAEVNSLLRYLDHAPPRVSADAIAALAHDKRFEWGRIAAGIVLAVVAAGAAYAAPGSPVPRWLDSLLRGVGAGEPTAPPVVSPPDASGIAVTPGDNLTIVFAAPLPHGNVTVSLNDSGDVEVLALGTNVSLTSEIGRLLVNARGVSVDFEIRIPRTAPRVEIVAGERRIFLKLGDRTITHGRRLGETYVISLTS